MNIYQEQILDHYHHPRNEGEPASFSHSCKLQNLSCGDEIEVFLTMENGKVKEMKFTGEGCAISIASASMLSEKVAGKSVEEINLMDSDYMADLLGIDLTPARTKCAHLSLQAVQKALSPQG